MAVGPSRLLHLFFGQPDGAGPGPRGPLRSVGAAARHHLKACLAWPCTRHTLARARAKGQRTQVWGGCARLPKQDKGFSIEQKASNAMAVTC